MKVMRIACLFIATGLSFAAERIDQPPLDAPRVTKTETFDLASRGTLHLKNSIGEVDVEGWDRPQVELTTIKYGKKDQARESETKTLDQVRVTADRQGDELTLSSEYPKRNVIERPVRGETNFILEYRIKAPRDAKLVIEQETGQVNIHDMRSDIRVTNHSGDVALVLPDAKYAIDAKSMIGSVVSDFPGKERREHLFGHQLEEAGAPAKLYLRVGFGDIIILKIRRPQS